VKVDQEIHNLILNRDEAGLKLLYSNYTNSLYGIAVRVLNNHAFAEDAIQKSFLKIWNNIDQYDSSKSTLFTWMAKIVKNSAIDIRRLKSFQAEEKSESIDPLVHDVERSYIDTDNIDTNRMIKELDDKYAFVLEHLYLKGYSQSELAKEFDIPIGTVKTRVKKGIEILRNKFKKENKFIFSFYSLTLIIIFVIL
jgi:RNA polymerase sigma-70 factor (ECF subfamily)